MPLTPEMREDIWAQIEVELGGFGVKPSRESRQLAKAAEAGFERDNYQPVIEFLKFRITQCGDNTPGDELDRFKFSILIRELTEEQANKTAGTS